MKRIVSGPTFFPLGSLQLKSTALWPYSKDVRPQVLSPTYSIKRGIRFSSTKGKSSLYAHKMSPLGLSDKSAAESGSKDARRDLLTISPQEKAFLRVSAPIYRRHSREQEASAMCIMP